MRRAFVERRQGTHSEPKPNGSDTTEVGTTARVATRRENVTPKRIVDCYLQVLDGVVDGRRVKVVKKSSTAAIRKGSRKQNCTPE